MPKVSPIQSDFSGGEISPLLYGRTDIPNYRKSLAISQNYLPLIQGPLTRRPGTSHIFPVKDSTAVTRLIPFEVSTTQAYMLEFGNNYIRFFKNYGVVTNAAKNITAITQANPGVLSSANHGLTNGMHIIVASVGGMVEINNREYTVANAAASTFTLVDNITGVAVDTTNYTTYTSGGTAAQIYEVTQKQAIQSYVSSYTNANPCSVTSDGHGFTNGQLVSFSAPTGILATQMTTGSFTVTVVDQDTFTIGVDSTAWAAYGGSVASDEYSAKAYLVTTGSVFATADLPTISFVQSNDTLYLVHPKYPPKKLVRMADNNWVLYDIFFLDGPYFPFLARVTKLTLDSTPTTPGQRTTITAGNVQDINGGVGFLSTDVGRLVRWSDASNNWAVFRITTVTSATVVKTICEMPAAAGSASTNKWQMSLYNSVDGYPSSVVFHEDRLVLAGCPATPVRFDGSNSGDYENFAPSGAGRPSWTGAGAYDGLGSSPTVANSNAYSFNLNSNNVNGIQWATSDEQALLMGTRGAEWKATTASNQQAMGPLSIVVKQITSYGSQAVQAVQSGKCTLFLQRAGKKLRELNYFADVYGYRAADLLQLSEHLTAGALNITFLAVQKIPQPVIWAVRSDGVLLSMVYERDLDALRVGWTRHIFGGAYSGGISIVESVAVLASQDGTTQDVYVIVKRTINGNTVRYVEYVTPYFDTLTNVKNAIFMDASLTYNGSPTYNVTGLNHLNGQTVDIIADGSVQASQTVSAGKLSFSQQFSVVTAGLNIVAQGQKLRNDAGSADGTAMGKTRRTHRLGIMLLNTLGFQLGSDFNNLDQVMLDNVDQQTYGVAQPPFTGVTTQLISSDYDFDNMTCWQQSQPLPGTIQGLYPQMITQDRG